MVTVVFYGLTGGYVTDEINKVLSPYGVLSVCGSKITSTGATPKFISVECNNRATLNIHEGIIVTIGKFTSDCYLNIIGNFKGVVFSTDKSALKMLKEKKITSITCGMAAEDTLILSSITDSAAIICLQRKITTLSGNIIEPAEYKVTLKNKITDYALLAAAAILLLCGIEPNGLEY